MDDMDARILRALRRDGRQSNMALAEVVGLSPSACSRRVQALEGAGVIRGYRAVLEPTALGGGFTTYLMVSLTLHTKEAQTAFEQAMQAAPEVSECHNITGQSEYLLRVEVADIDAYKRFHTDVVGTLPMVRGLVTHVVMGSPKDLRA